MFSKNLPKINSIHTVKNVIHFSLSIAVYYAESGTTCALKANEKDEVTQLLEGNIFVRNIQ